MTQMESKHTDFLSLDMHQYKIYIKHPSAGTTNHQINNKQEHFDLPVRVAWTLFL